MTQCYKTTNNTIKSKDLCLGRIYRFTSFNTYFKISLVNELDFMGEFWYYQDTSYEKLFRFNMFALSTIVTLIKR